MKKLLSILLCVVFILSLASCQNDDVTESTESASVVINPIASFNTVEDFKIAVKKNPTQYIDKQISVKGYANKNINLVTNEVRNVWLYDDLLLDSEKYDGRLRIEVFITDSTLRVVVEDGDYIKIYGTVKISGGEIHLDNCTYTMITTNKERK